MPFRGPTFPNWASRDATLRTSSATEGWSGSLAGLTPRQRRRHRGPDVRGGLPEGPSGVICLLSALVYHKLGTQLPAEVWLAIGQKSRTPRIGSLPVHVVRFSGRALTEGIEEHVIRGVRIRVTTPAKTVADCFKFRNKIGLEVALEALRDFRRRHRRSMDELWRQAEICRVARVMRPYLEAFGA